MSRKVLRKSRGARQAGGRDGGVRHRVFIVEDHPTMRATLRDFLENLQAFTVCGTAGTAEEALDELPNRKADVVLVDVALPNMNGIELVRELTSRHPDLRCLMLSAHPGAQYIRGALDAGARGYVIKGDPYELETALETVLNGGTYLSSAVPDLRRGDVTRS